MLPSHHVEAQGNGAYKARAHRSIVRLARRREGLGVQSLADLTNLPLTGCGAFVLDGTKCFHDVTLQGCVSFRGRHQDQYPLSSDKTKTK